MKILVFEELRKTKIKVGILYREKGSYCFNYEPDYLNKPLATSLGPDLPLGLVTIKSKVFFKTLEDFIPDKRNPAYVDYCHVAGISPDEKNKFKLLTSVGKRGASKFVFEELQEEQLLSAKKIREFRKKLHLSQRDFALFFDIPLISLQQLEKNVPGQKITKRLIGILMEHKELMRNQVKKRGYWLHPSKLTSIINYLEGNAANWSLP